MSMTDVFLLAFTLHYDNMFHLSPTMYFKTVKINRGLTLCLMCLFLLRKLALEFLYTKLESISFGVIIASTKLIYTMFGFCCEVEDQALCP